MSAKKKIVPRSKGKGKSYALEEYGIYWMARSADDSASGCLWHNKKNGTFRAIANELELFKKLCKPSRVLPENSPVDERGMLKSEFLLLPTLRARFHDECEGSDLVAASWRSLYFRLRKYEVEQMTGEVLPDSDWTECNRMIGNPAAFDKYAMDVISGYLHEDDTASRLMRLGEWLESFESRQGEVLDLKARQYLRAIEAAARQSNGVPTHKAVLVSYNNVVGSGLKLSEDGSRSVRDKLGFGWLPGDVRGRSRRNTEKDGQPK